MKVAWVMNLDAELELESPARFTRSSRMLARLTDRGSKLVTSFVTCFGIEAALANRGLDSSWIGQAWCPTQSAHAAIAECGAASLRSPSLEVISRVNHRAFAAEIAQNLPHASFVTTMSALDEVVSQAAVHGWLVKRPYGFAGRSRKRFLGTPTGAERTWAEASMAGYGLGLQVEPFVDLELELAMHGILNESGVATMGPVFVQHCDEDGAWLSQRPLQDGDLRAEELSSFEVNAQTVAQALSVAGYFGPFSIDGFVWRCIDGKRRLQPLSDLNARYSMGFFDAMAGVKAVREFIVESRL